MKKAKPVKVSGYAFCCPRRPGHGRGSQAHQQVCGVRGAERLRPDMIIKAIEIRDSMTFIPAVAIKVVSANEGQRYLLRRAGYSIEGDTVILMSLTTPNRCAYDPYDWPGSARTFREAHLWLVEHFDELEDGAVVDVQHILGETPEPKRSERHEFAV